MNYLFIGCDQLRFDTLSVNGNEVCSTPNLDALAKEGVNFTNAYSTAPLCTPARASMFTGNYAFTHKMGTNCDMYHSLAAELENPDLLLHKRLLENNYKCGYVGKWHVGTELGPCDFGFEGMNVPGYGNCRLDEGFKEYLVEKGLSYNVTNEIYLNPNDKTLCAGIWDGVDESSTDWYLTDKTIELMETYRKNDENYFVTCQYWGPHGPHLPPKNWVGKADRSKILPWDNYIEDLSQKPEFVNRHLLFYRKAPQNWEECREIIGLYYDQMMFIDYQIGRLIEYLKETNQYDNTAILFTCDHGDMQFAHNGLIDKGFLYEEAMHIPMIVRHPKYLHLGTNDALVSNMDIMPTVLDDLNIDISCHGQSLIPVIKNEKRRDDIYMEFHGIHFLYTQRVVIDSSGMKFIWTPGDIDELYDLNVDPYEKNNLINSADKQTTVEHMVELLKKNAVQYGDPVMDYIYKIFGQWESPSGQVDATSARYNK